MKFRDTVRPLLLAPLAGVGFIVFMELTRLRTNALIMGLVSAPFCYAAELLFVVPVMWLWPASRRPGFLTAAIWGALTALAASAFVMPSLRELGRPVVFFGFGFAGALSGLLYAQLVRHSSRMKHSN